MMATKKPKRTGDREVAKNKKVAHNVVECRRKQRISHSVKLLSHLVSPCDCGKETKADVLQKAVDKIKELELSNRELQNTINEQSSDGSDESHLQTKLALTVLEHLHLILSIINHQESIKQPHNSNNDATKLSLDKNKTVNSERLGFGVENLLETTPPFERTHVHSLSQDYTVPISIGTRGSGNIDGNLETPPPWYYSHHSSQQQSAYYSIDSIDWSHSFPSPAIPTPPPPPPPPPIHHPYLSQQQQAFHPYSRRLINPSNVPPYVQPPPAERGPPQTMWRPYNDTISLPPPPPPPPNPSTASGAYQQQPSTSFLVGQLLENI